MQNMQPKFYCDDCDYKCSKKFLWSQHLETAKHLKAKSSNSPANKANEKYVCSKCNIMFKHQSSYCRHKKKCQHNSVKNNCEDANSDNDEISLSINEEDISNKELILMLVKQNAELLQIVKNGTMNHSHNTTHTNSHNKTFNLNFFLNETCKNAMNIEEFVDQIVLNLHDLEETARLGFAEGVSKMIMQRLNALDVTKRPIHCSDLKRETLYIKNENKWEKEEDSKPKLTKAVKQIAGKNIKQIFEWQKVHPDYSDPDSKENDKYMKMLTHVMSGGTIEETNTNYEKVVRNITKETTIDKDQFAV
jgi:hypothetical protein